MPLGGAGTTEYYLADELSKDPAFRVTWLFSSEVDTVPLSHPRIRIVSPRMPVRQGVPIVSRWINRARTRAPFRHIRQAVMIVSPWKLEHPLYQLAVELGYRSIVRIASDLNVVDDGTPGCIASRIKRGCGGKDRYIDAVAFQSEQQQTLMGSCGFALGKVMTKGWPIRDGRVLPESRSSVLWIGGCRPVKQPWVFLDLAESMPECAFTMLMPTNEGKFESFGKEIEARARTIPNLELLTEQLPISSTDSMFDRALVFVNTSESEGFPSTFLQAGVAGVPIVSLSVDPDEMIQRNGLGAVCGSDPERLKLAVRRYSDSGSAEWQRAARANWEYIRAHHDIRDSAEECKMLIRDVVTAAQSSA